MEDIIVLVVSGPADEEDKMQETRLDGRNLKV